MRAFGPMLRDLRQELDLSQAELAGRISSTQRHISFLETGRSKPTEGFVLRICRDLGLAEAQKANLFAACDAQPPITRSAFSDAQITEALNLLDRHVLANWPFPAMVLDSSWNILRQNAHFTTLMAPFLPAGNPRGNFMQILLNDGFCAMVTNWDDLAPALYYRLQAAAGHSATLRALLDQARADGRFDGCAPIDAGDSAPSVYVPIRLQFPNGLRINTSSLMGQLAALHPALIEGFEIELILPTDPASEQALRAFLQSPNG